MTIYCAFCEVYQFNPTPVSVIAASPPSIDLSSPQATNNACSTATAKRTLPAPRTGSPRPFQETTNRAANTSIASHLYSTCRSHSLLLCQRRYPYTGFHFRVLKDMGQLQHERHPYRIYCGSQWKRHQGNGAARE